MARDNRAVMRVTPKTKWQDIKCDKMRAWIRDPGRIFLPKILMNFSMGPAQISPCSLTGSLSVWCTVYSTSHAPDKKESYVFHYRK
jgi:hypothetical protein